MHSADSCLQNRKSGDMPPKRIQALRSSRWWYYFFPRGCQNQVPCSCPNKGLSYNIFEAGTFKPNLYISLQDLAGASSIKTLSAHCGVTPTRPLTRWWDQCWTLPHESPSGDTASWMLTASAPPVSALLWDPASLTASNMWPTTS